MDNFIAMHMTSYIARCRLCFKTTLPRPTNVCWASVAML